MLVVFGAVVGVAALRQRADDGRRSEVLLAHLQSLTQEQYGQLGRGVADQAASERLLAEVRRSRAEFDAVLAELRGIGLPDDHARAIPAQAEAFQLAADGAFAHLVAGAPELARHRVQSQATPSAMALMATLREASADTADTARRLNKGTDLGSLAVLVVACFVVWLLVRRTGRAQLEAQRVLADANSQERFRSLIQNSSDVITVVGADGRIRYQTPSVEQVFGYQPATLEGTDLAHLVHPDDLRSVQLSLAQSVRGEGAERLECRVRHADGSWRYTETTVSVRLDDPLVEGLILNTRDTTERKELEEQLAHQAFHDSLTGLANRALFRNRIEHSLARMRRSLHPVGVLLFDLDGFKTINDSLGHALGDQILQAVGERLQSLLRPMDTACRLGGDEFAVLIEDLNDAGGATTVAERLLEGFSTSFEIDGKEITMGASLGVAIATPDTADLEADDLLRNADVAMYRAKELGRGRYELFKPSMHQAMLDRLDLEADLRRALHRGEFVLHYQPYVHLSDGRISGMEALVRWQSPERGLVPPGVFIPIIEDTGLIVPLGAWVLKEACRQAVAWQQEFGTDELMTMSVNVSAQQLQDDRLVDEVAKILDETGMVPDKVVLEITESAVMSDAEAMVARLHALKALGVRLAIDDFGTGYSSMSYLCSFPIDILKIDRSFVHGVPDEPQKIGIVRTIVELGHILELQTVAEGIELVAELEQLRALECDLGQGYHFARPLAPEAIEDLLRQQGAARRRDGFRIVPAAG